MPVKSYPFIDIAVHDRVRAHFARGDAVCLFSLDLSEVLWSNGEGAALFGVGSIYDFLDAGPAAGDVGFRQLQAAARGLSEIGAVRRFTMRIPQGFRSLAVSASAERIAIRSGEQAVLFATPRPGKPLSGAQAAARMLSGFDDPDTHMAVLDGEGGVVAASPGFAALGMRAQTLASLVAAVGRDADWLLKRPVPTGRGTLPAAIGKLSDAPALHLLFAVETILGHLDAVPELDEPLAGLPAEPAAPAPSPSAAATTAIATEAPARGPEAAPLVEVEDEAAEDGPEPFLWDAPEAVAPLADETVSAETAPPPAAEEMMAAEDMAEDGVRAEDTVAETAPDDADARAAIEGGRVEPAMTDGTGERIADAEGTDSLADLPDEAPQEESLAAEQDRPAEAESAIEDAGTPDRADTADNVTSGFRFDPGLRAVRFVWKIGADGRFSEISPEFGQAVGPRAAEIIGETFEAVAARLGLDRDETISTLLRRRDTWSGKTVFWPVEAAALRVPVDLAALPTYSRNRDFDGFRGFGIVRLSDAVVDDRIVVTGAPAAPEAESAGDAADASGETAQEDDRSSFEAAVETDDPFRGERPALKLVDTPARRASDSVVALETHRSGPLETLTRAEQAAFREIARQLGTTFGKRTAPPAPPAAAFEAGESDGETIAPLPLTPEAGRTDEAAAMADGDPARPEGPAGDTAATEAPALPVGNAARSDADEAESDPAQPPAAIPPSSLAAPSAPVAEDAPGEAEEEANETATDMPAATDEPSLASPEQAPETAPAERLSDDDMTNPAPAGSAALPADDLDRASMPEESKDPAEGEAPAQDESHPVAASPDDGRSAATHNRPAEPSDAVTEAPIADAGARATDAPSEDEAADDGAVEDAADEHGRDGSLLSVAALDLLPTALLVHNGDDLYHANPAFLTLTGYETLEELRVEGGLDALFVGEDEGLLDTPEGAVMLIRHDGRLLPVQARLQSVRLEDHGAALMMSLATLAPATPAPVTLSLVPPSPPLPAEMPAAEPPAEPSFEPGVETLAALREKDARNTALAMEADELRSILETATDGVVVTGADGEIRSLNRSASALFNYDDGEVRGKPFAMLFAHESQRAVMDYLAGLAGHGVASVLNDGREVIGREAGGGFIPLFMTMGRLSSSNGYCAVIRDITQWKRSEEELRAAKRAAETANAHKTEFLARVSHEIRTPLNAIIGFSDMMASEHFGPIGNPRYVEYAGDIGRSGRHVLDIVNDLLDISKIEAGEMELDFAEVEINEAVSEAVALVQPQANMQRVIIRTSLPGTVPTVVADQRSIKQIALNILSNAIRFTPSGGQIVVSTAYEPNGSVVLRIRDTGIGMTRTELEQAMKPFRQVTTGSRKRGDGTGLGLPLTKAMTEANRAAFSIHSAPNEGTLVEIAFPSQRVLAN